MSASQHWQNCGRGKGCQRAEAATAAGRDAGDEIFPTVGERGEEAGGRRKDSYKPCTSSGPWRPSIPSSCNLLVLRVQEIERVLSAIPREDKMKNEESKNRRIVCFHCFHIFNS